MIKISDRSKKRVAFILSQFPSYDETFILREMRGIEKRNIEIVVFSLRQFRDKIIHEDAVELKRHTIYAPYLLSLKIWLAHIYFLMTRPKRYLSALKFVSFPFIKRPMIMMRNIAFFPKSVYFARIMEEQNLTHIHASWATYPATMGLVISKLNNASFSFAGHAHDIFLDSSALGEKIDKASFVVTCTEYNKKYLQSFCHNGGRQKIKVSYHGLALDKFKTNGHTKCKQFRILSVGSLLECKGYPNLIRVCARLHEAEINFKCIIAGGGKLEAKLRSLVDQLDLTGCVDLVGYVTQEEIVKYYHWADVFVLSALAEIHWGIPNVLIEAAASHVPVICTDLPSLNEVFVNEVSGLIVKDRDLETLYNSLVRLYNEPQTRDRLAAAAYESVYEKYDERKTTEFMSKLFEKVFA